MYKINLFVPMVFLEIFTKFYLPRLHPSQQFSLVWQYLTEHHILALHQCHYVNQSGWTRNKNVF